MNGRTGSGALDDALLDRLREVVQQVDPMPEVVLASAQAAFGLRQLDAELAELVRDSAEERGGVLTVRGEGDVRLISFETGPITVELQVTERGSARDLVAQITGIGVRRAEVETPGLRLPTTLEDSVATADGVAAGLLRLHVHTVDGRELVTSWVRV
jgi:hypothetical protein